MRALTGYQGSISGRRRALLDQLTTLETDSGSSEAEKGPFRQSEGPAIPKRAPSSRQRALLNRMWVLLGLRKALSFRKGSFRHSHTVTGPIQVELGPSQAGLLPFGLMGGFLMLAGALIRRRQTLQASLSNFIVSALRKYILRDIIAKKSDLIPYERIYPESLDTKNKNPGPDPI